MAFIIHHEVIPSYEMTKNPVIPGYFIIRYRQNGFL